MSSLAVSNTFTSGTVAIASQVNANFSDIANYVNNRNSGASKWDALAVSGNTVLDGTLSVGGISIVGSGGGDGWATGETWTYASASTFTISGDKTGIYSVGDKIQLTQTTPKFFYITATSYLSPNTTITVSGGDTFSLANASITTPLYSKVTSPNGFPGYFSFTWTDILGFSSVTINRGYFSLQGKNLTVHYKIEGVSNSTQLIATLPLPVSNVFANAIPIHRAIGTDNGSLIDTAFATMDQNMLSCYRTSSSDWTSSGTKGCAGEFSAVLS